MNRPFRVGIMGAGAIAQGFDSPASRHVLTLAHAVALSSQFELGGFYDIDSVRSQEAEKKWTCPATPRDRQGWLNCGWDVICIATPDEQHTADLTDALSVHPRTIVVEKPLTLDIQEGTRLLTLASERRVPVLVDYPRRWHSAIARTAEIIDRGLLGAPRSFTLAYSGSAPRSASHMLDLFLQLWGPGWHLTPDSQSSGSIHLSRGGDRIEVVNIGLPFSHYVWEMSVHCDLGKVQLMGNPEVLTVFTLEKHPLYHDFSVLGELFSAEMESEPLLSGLFNTMYGAIQEPNRASAVNDREMASMRFVAAGLRILAGKVPA